jgi:site-specific recombinase XerD
MLSGGMVLMGVSVVRILGYQDLAVVQRYPKQTSDDLRQAHAANSPVDREE